MQVCRTIPDMRAAVARYRAAGDSVGLVPTMGALHAGHRALMLEARGAHDRVVATIFVNPTQFGSPSDLAVYPRTESADLALLELAGVDAVLIPEAKDLYPDGEQTIVEVTHLSAVFHGAVRPGHFRGVATVVTKLFNIVQPDTAYFGEKDYQQLAVIRRMVQDLHMPVAVRGVATVRDPDGLALSSRNVRLTKQDRAAAVVLNRALTGVAHLAATGAVVEDLVDAIRATIRSEPRARLKAVDVVEVGSFAPATGQIRGPIGVMVSAEFGPQDDPVLLIDQREIAPRQED